MSICNILVAACGLDKISIDVYFKVPSLRRSIYRCHSFLKIVSSSVILSGMALFRAIPPSPDDKMTSLGTYWKPSIDLAEQAQYHLAFLKTVSNVPKLHEDAFLRNAARRYEVLWLPLLAKHPQDDLEPPLDVHWVWHCHLLSPRAYHKDCRQVVGMVPDHKLRIDRHDFDGAIQRAQALWEQLYPEEPFTIDFDASVDPPQYMSRIGYDLVGASGRQKDFYYNVSLPHYTDDKFLNAALWRYIKFVKLKNEFQKQFLGKLQKVFAAL